MTTSTTTPGIVGRFVHPDDLMCPCCRGGAVELPTADPGRCAGFVHRDGSMRCGAQAGRVVEPIEVAR